MLSNVIPFSLKAVLWYQGEANSGVAEAAIYLDLLDAFIGNVRAVICRDVCQTDDIHPKNKEILSLRIVDAPATL